MSRHAGLARGTAFFLSLVTPLFGFALWMLLISGAGRPPAFAAPVDSPLERPNLPAPFSQSGPQADFSADPQAGSAPLAVQFTDRSTGPVEAWL